MKIGAIELGKNPVVVGTISEKPQFSCNDVDLVDIFEIRADMLHEPSPLQVKKR